MTYNFSIKHDITSTQTANDISLDVFLPYYVTFKMADTENFEVIVDDEKVDILGRVYTTLLTLGRTKTHGQS